MLCSGSKVHSGCGFFLLVSGSANGFRGSGRFSRMRFSCASFLHRSFSSFSFCSLIRSSSDCSLCSLTACTSAAILSWRFFSASLRRFLSRSLSSSMRFCSSQSAAMIARCRPASQRISSTSSAVKVSCMMRLLPKKSSIFAIPDGISLVAARMLIPILLCIEIDFSSSSVRLYPSDAYFASIFSLSHAVMSAVKERST